MININLHTDNNIVITIPIFKNLIEIYQKGIRDNKQEDIIWSHYALNWAIRRLDAYLPRVKVSKKAAALAKKKGIGDISFYKWDDQKAQKKMKDPKYKYFHYEHIKPVAEIRRELESLNPITDEGIYTIIKQVDIAWITKEEAKCLGAHGRKTDKIPHFVKIQECGIEFI